MTLTRSMARLTAGLAGAALLSAAFSAQARELSVSTVLSEAFPWGQAAESGQSWWRSAAVVNSLCGSTPTLSWCRVTKPANFLPCALG